MAKQNTKLCELCETRRARRACPGVRGDICSVCCGAEREVTVSCPLDCSYLEEARRFERTPELDREKMPSPEVEITEEFLHRNSGLLALMSHTIAETALRIPQAVDSDVRQGLDSLVRTYRTLESGLYYETLPANPIAGAFHQALREAVERARQELRRSSGMTPYRDADVLGALVFLQRIHYLRENGRPRGRAFIHALLAQAKHRERDMREQASPIILP